MRWSLGPVVAAVMTLGAFVLPTHGQLPSISDVNGDGGTAAAGPLPTWDVAVIKPHPANDGSMSWQMTTDSVQLRNLTLEMMICSAWDLKSYQITGLSGWMEKSSFDLTAKVGEDDLAQYKKLNTDQRRQMLQKLLIERFHLKAHPETKTLPVYDLVVDKGGPKLQPTTALSAPSPEEEKAHPDRYKKGSWSTGQGTFEGMGVPVHTLVSQLADVLEKPVHDTTGLTGLYDMKLKYRPENSAPDKDEDLPSVFSALQEQLGLKLVSDKGPVQILVVDAAQQPEVD